LVERIDFLLGRHDDEKISAGEAVAGMIINGLGFTDRSMTLTPQCYENCPVELLFRDGVQPSDFNRFKLGRTLDEIHEFGCTDLFSDLAYQACSREEIESQFGHLDTTSFSLTGQYLEDSDEHAIAVTHGYSKDHRPDLKQVILELLVSQDGGVPLLCKTWDGNTSDNEVFSTRAKALVEGLQKNTNPIYLVADSKLYSNQNAESLAHLQFITRIPETILLVKEKISQAFQEDKWVKHDEKKKFHEVF